MDRKALYNELTELEAINEAFIQRALNMKKFLTEAKRKMAGVSTPAPDKGLSAASTAIIKRRKRQQKSAI